MNRKRELGEAGGSSRPAVVRRAVCRALVGVAIAFGIGACGAGHQDWVMKVNGEKVSEGLFNGARKALSIPESSGANGFGAVVDQLATQAVIAQEAEAKGLDKEPDVVAALEHARRAILGRAYLDRVAAGAKQPTAEEVEKYYGEHAELFARRRIYDIEEFDVAGALATDAGKVRDLVAANRPVEEALATTGLKAKISTVRMATEQLAPGDATAFLKLPPGAAVVRVTPSGMMVLRLKGAVEAALPLEKVKPQIQAYLFDQKQKLLASDEILRLRKTADISFADKYEAFVQAVTQSAPISHK